ncbi:hypothetical protein D3C78_1490740 [compost metagenome]
MLAHPLQQHADGENHGDRVGLVLTCDIRRGAMLCLGAAVNIAGHHGAGETQATRQFTGEVADDVAVEVRSDQHVETLRAAHQVGSRRIDQQIVQSHFWEVLCHITDALQEQAISHMEAVGFVNGSDLLVTLHSQLERSAGNSLTAMTSDFTRG